jgi:hypothetical protein
MFKGDESLEYAIWRPANPSVKGCIFYINAMVDNDLTDRDIKYSRFSCTRSNIQRNQAYDIIAKQVAFFQLRSEDRLLEDIVQGIVSGTQ